MAPELIICGILLATITLYAIMGGADFGAGVWEFNTALRASEKEREQLYRAIGPVWEANHVWLLFALVMMFSAFPIAFAAISRALWIPLLLALLGIFARGIGFAFRKYAAGAVRQQAVFGAVFAFASTSTPFFFGACAGAIASGIPVTDRGHFTGDHIAVWTRPLPIFCAFFAVGLCSYIAAVFMCRESENDRDEQLSELWRRRALKMGVILGVFSTGGLVLVAREAPELWTGFQSSGLPFVLTSGAAGLLSMLFVWKSRFVPAAVAASITVATVTLGWGAAQYPVLIPPNLTIASTKAPDSILWAMTIAIAGGAVVLVPSLGWLLFLFKRRNVE